MNKKLIEWIKSEEAQGYSEKQLRDYLIKEGYSKREIEDAIKSNSKSKIYSSNKILYWMPIIFLIVGILIITIILFHFMDFDAHVEKKVYMGSVKPIPIVTQDIYIDSSPTLGVDIIPCNSVTKEYNCDSSFKFNRGDKIYFLIGIDNIKIKSTQDTNYYELSIEKQLTNLNNKRIIMSFDESSEIIKKESIASDYINIQVIKEVITLKDDTLGDYEYTVRIRDTSSNREAVKKVQFVLE